MKSPQQFATLNVSNKKQYVVTLLGKVQTPACVRMRNKIELFPAVAGNMYDEIYTGLYNSFHHHQNTKRLNKIRQIQQTMRLYEEADASELDSKLNSMMASI